MKKSFNSCYQLTREEFLLFNDCSKIELLDLHGVYLLSTDDHDTCVGHLYRLYDFYTELSYFREDRFTINTYTFSQLPDYYMNSLALIDFF